jgi:hypothetical protein
MQDQTCQFPYTQSLFFGSVIVGDFIRLIGPYDLLDLFLPRIIPAGGFEAFNRLR